MNSDDPHAEAIFDLHRKRQGFTDTDKDFAWADDEDGSKMLAFLDRMHTEGFTKCSDAHIPLPTSYEYQFFGPLMFFRPRTVMSSPKSVSPSVPAVAGGGEDGARLNFCLGHRCYIELDGMTEQMCNREDIDEAIAAIAATTAKEGRP